MRWMQPPVLQHLLLPESASKLHSGAWDYKGSLSDSFLPARLAVELLLGTDSGSTVAWSRQSGCGKKGQPRPNQILEHSWQPGPTAPAAGASRGDKSPALGWQQSYHLGPEETPAVPSDFHPSPVRLC